MRPRIQEIWDENRAGNGTCSGSGQGCRVERAKRVEIPGFIVGLELWAKGFRVLGFTDLPGADHEVLLRFATLLRVKSLL